MSDFDLQAAGSPDRPWRILIADDEPSVRELLSLLCKQMGYQVVAAENGAEALRHARLDTPDLVLLDAMMPEMDGFSATKHLRTDPSTAAVPIVILTALNTREDRLRAIAAGANDFLSKPVDSEELMLRVKNNLQFKMFHDFLKRHASILEEQVDERTRRLTEAFDTLKRAHSTIEDIHRDTIFRLAALAEYRDEDTGAHIRRIGYYARELARTLGLDREFCESIFYAAMPHDIGKVAVPDAVLLKPGKLTEGEWEVMRGHTSFGARILAGSQSPYLRMGARIAQHHHERWDGSGYPAGLRGDAIPLAARIVAIADNYDALRSVRPYKPSFDHRTTCRIIEVGDGRTLPAHFDPEVLAAFSRSKGLFAQIFEEHARSDE